MTVADLLCDLCARPLTGSAIVAPEEAGAAVRLLLHPGDPLHKDDGVLVCLACWAGFVGRFGPGESGGRCAACGAAVAYEESLHVLEMTGRSGEAPLWQFCRAHAVEVLNGFRFVEPKLGPGDLTLKVDFTAR